MVNFMDVNLTSIKKFLTCITSVSLLTSEMSKGWRVHGLRGYHGDELAQCQGAFSASHSGLTGIPE